jgi:hypothetical protein
MLSGDTFQLLLPPLIKKELRKEESPRLFSLSFHTYSSARPFPSIPSHESSSSGLSMSKFMRTITMWVLLSKKSMFYNLIFSSHIKPAIVHIIRMINAELDFVFLTLIPINTSNANNCDI